MFLEKKKWITAKTLCFGHFPYGGRFRGSGHPPGDTAPERHDRSPGDFFAGLKAEHERKLRIKSTGEVIPPEVFPNGDTRPQLLVRSRYLLFKSAENWNEYVMTISQEGRSPLGYNSPDTMSLMRFVPVHPHHVAWKSVPGPG